MSAAWSLPPNEDAQTTEDVLHALRYSDVDPLVITASQKYAHF